MERARCASGPTAFTRNLHLEAGGDFGERNGNLRECDRLADARAVAAWRLARAFSCVDFSAARRRRGRHVDDARRVAGRRQKALRIGAHEDQRGRVDQRIRLHRRRRPQRVEIDEAVVGDGDQEMAQSLLVAQEQVLRLGTRQPHLHFHCVVLDGVFDATATGRVVFHAATGLETNAIAQVQAQVRRRLLHVFARPRPAVER